MKTNDVPKLVDVAKALESLDRIVNEENVFAECRVFQALAGTMIEFYSRSRVLVAGQLDELYTLARHLQGSLAVGPSLTDQKDPGTGISFRTVDISIRIGPVAVAHTAHAKS